MLKDNDTGYFTWCSTIKKKTPLTWEKKKVWEKKPFSPEYKKG